MNLILDITAKNSFAAWEWGSWNEETGTGSAHIIGDQASQKLKVIYDRSPMRSALHALVYANAGYVVAGCVIKREGQSLNCHVEFGRISGLTTKLTASEPNPMLTRQSPPKVTPEATLDILYMTRKLVPIRTLRHDQLEDLIEDLLADFPQPYDLIGLPNAREMMCLAIEKAFTPNEEQRIFYAHPRVIEPRPSNQDDEDY